MTRARMMGTFFAVTALVSWAPLLLLRGEGFDSRIGRAVSIFYAFGPLVAALVVQGPLLKAKVLEPLGISREVNRFWLVAWLAPLVVLATGLLAGYLLEGMTPILGVEQLIESKRAMVPPEHLEAFEARLREGRPPHPLLLVLFALPAGLTFNLLPAFAEEVGLRGFLYREMPGGYVARSLSIGLVSFVWAAPALALGMWYREDPALGLFVGLAFHLALSLVSVYIRVRTGSVVACAIFRGTTASLVPVAIDLSGGASELVRPMYGVGGVLGLLVVFACFVAHDRLYAKQKLL